MAGHICRCVVLSLNFAKSATLCSFFVEWRDCQNCKVYPAFAGATQERDIQIEHYLQLRLSISKTHQIKRLKSLKAMDRIWFRPIHPFTYSSNQNKQLSCLVPFQSVNALRIAEPQGTMKDHERPKVMVNGHEWPWLAMNDHKWRRCMPWTSHLPSNTIHNQPLASQHIAAFHTMQSTSKLAVLSVRLVLHHLLQFPLILAKRPILLANTVLTCVQTHMNEHISAWVCRI